MELRTRANVINYRALNNGRLISPKTNGRVGVSDRQKPKRMLARLENQINYNLHNLLKFKVSNRIVQFKLEVENRLYSYLKDTYNLNNRFKQASDLILDDFNLIHSRMCPHNLRNRVRLDTGFFFMRIFKKKDILLENRRIAGPCFIYFKFKKINEILW
jgi:hypothetical protein